MPSLSHESGWCRCSIETTAVFKCSSLLHGKHTPSWWIYVILYYIILYYIILYHIILHYIILHYIILCFAMLHYITLYYIIREIDTTRYNLIWILCSSSSLSLRVSTKNDLIWRCHNLTPWAQAVDSLFLVVAQFNQHLQERRHNIYINLSVFSWFQQFFFVISFIVGMMTFTCCHRGWFENIKGQGKAAGAKSEARVLRHGWGWRGRAV